MNEQKIKRRCNRHSTKLLKSGKKKRWKRERKKKKSKTVQQEIDFTEIEKLNFLLNGESRMLFMPHIKYKCYAW